MARTRAGSIAKERKRRIGLKSIAMWPGRFFWKEVGRKRDCSILIGSDTSQCQACKKVEGTEKHRLYHCPEWYEVRREIPEVFRRLEKRSGSGKEELLNILSVEVNGTGSISA